MDPLDGGPSVEARKAFDGFVDSLAAGSAIDFEDWCRGRPALEDELRVLWLRWLAARGGAVRSPSAAPGPSPAPGRPSSGSPLKGVDLGFASAILGRLGAHGETWRRYQREGEIAHGGQGVVLRVWDGDLSRPLAMKVLHDRGGRDSAVPAADPRSLGRFLEEALVTGQLDHPGIVPVHELGLDSDGRLYFTMKLVKGRTLREVFELVARGEEGWTRTRALSVMLKVCEATAYAHAKGVIHRDLKPSNVMVGRFGEVFVMDWGLARVLGQNDLKDIRIRPPGTTELRSERHGIGSLDSPLITMDGDVVGTPSYMSPEQALGRLDDVGPQSDVYSTGAMLYHLLCGHAPYVEPGMRLSNHAIWYQVQKGPPTPLHQCAPGTPAELVAICEKAMARDWRARYGDTSELAEDLSAFLEHRVVHAYRTGAVAELRKWIVRNRGLAGALAAAVILLIGGLATSLVLKELAENRLDKLVQLSQLQDHEDLLARVDELWPVRPERLPEYSAWIDAARDLVDDLPQHRARREELRLHALPLTPEEREAQRQTHPEHARLVQLAGEIGCKRRALQQRRDGVRAELPDVDPRGFPVPRMRALAWERVDPQRGLLGEEPLGLALALRARESAPGDPEVLRAVAWAFFALGRDEEALDAGYAMLQAAPESARPALEDSFAALEEATSTAASEAELRRAEGELADLERLEGELVTRVGERHDWRFPEDEPEARWWNNQLTKLIDGLESLQRELLAEAAISPTHGWSVPKRVAFARALERSFAAGGEHATAWERALPAIRAAYPGLEPAPQLGLVPLGPDPRSGLWEFAHLETGAVPERDARGELVLGEGSALVLVLLPGGTSWMGAQAADPSAPNFDPEAEPSEALVEEVTLSPFFLAKHEMTQGQWLRAAGENPSFHPPGQFPGVTLIHPVEMVSWDDCARSLERLGLLLPTEAQWEYAARAGTATPWWTGRQRESLRGKANLADRALRRAGGELFTPDDWPDLDDGYAVHAPANAFAANPFGLWNVHGNLYEWCRDGSPTNRTPPREGDGERPGLPQHRTYRGGSFIDIAAHARSSFRASDVTGYRSEALGVRPARVVER